LHEQLSGKGAKGNPVMAVINSMRMILDAFLEMSHPISSTPFL
jgi:hypothetical protein